MQHNIKSFFITLLIALLPSVSFASLQVASDGGLQVGSTDAPYWFNLSGVLKLDERVYMGNTQTTASGLGNLGTYMGGAFIRDMGLTLEGGVGENLSYNIGLDFEASSNQAKVDTAYITYTGFKCLLPNLSFAVGQVSPGFCLSCADSSKWIPFMERSMGTNVFGPQPGMGANANTYNDNYSATIAATQQPKSGTSIKNVYGQNIRTHDLWQGSGRFTFAPISEAGRVLQIGLSAHIQEYANTGLQFRANPEMRSGNSTSLLNTTTFYTDSQSNTGPGKQLMISALNQKTVDIEMLGIRGPWSGELEYQKAYIARGTVDGVKQGNNLSFSGFHAQASYVLTGQGRSLKKSNGTLNKPTLNGRSAWEVSARYSFISLDDQDINGGRAYNTTASLSWYANNNIRVIGEYVYSLQRRQFETYADNRHVSGLGARLQLVF